MTTRPTWPYVMGGLGAAAFGIGAWMLGYVASADNASVGTARLAGLVFGVGSLVLGIGWMGVFKQRQAGVGVIAGSLAIPLALLFISTNRDDWGAMLASGMILLVAMMFFAFAHVFVTGLPITRFVAACTSLALIAEIVMEVAKVEVARDTRDMLGIVALGGLGAIGFTLAFGFASLHREPVREDQL